MAIRCPEGCRDLLPDEAAYWERFASIARDVFSKYEYVSIYTPMIEQTELFVRGIGEATDVVSKEMFAAISGKNMEKLLEGEKIRSKSRLSLRPEGTAGVVRAIVQHDLVPDGAPPVKLMYAGPMFRAERPQHGRQRQFNQIGVECLGSADPTVDAEAIIMLMAFYERIGIESSMMRLLINSMGCGKCRPAYRELVHDYLSQNVDSLCDACKVRMEANPLRAFDCKEDGCKQVMSDAPKITDHLCEECSQHYAKVKGLLSSQGIEFVEDPALVRGLDYYTRTVFEVQATQGIGAQDAIGGGGRYDDLSKEIGGRSMPGFGFALGYDRCMLYLREKGMEFEPAKRCDVFVASVNDEVRDSAFELVQMCRYSDLRAEMDHQSRSLKSQFKLADKLDARVVVILGPDELARGEVKVRDMESHEESLVDKNEAVAAILDVLR